MRRKPSKLELLAEAKALEELGAEWTLAHAAAFCNRSVTYLTRSDCPKHRRKMNGIKGRTQPVCLPSEVRAWWAEQNADHEAAA